MTSSDRASEYHPLLLAVAEGTGSVSETIDRLGDRSDPVIRSLGLLDKAAADPDLRDKARRRVSGIDLERVHPDLHLMLLISWAKMAMYDGGVAEESALVRQAGALVNDRTHPWLSCKILGIRAHLVSCQGNWDGSLRLMREGVSLLNPATSAYAKELCIYARSLASVGRLTEVEDALSGLDLSREPWFERLRDYARMVHQFETGNLDEALRSAETAGGALYGEQEASDYRALGALLEKVRWKPFDPLAKTAQAESPGLDAMQAMTPGYRRPYWVDSARMLLDGDIRAAEGHKRANLGTMLESFLADMQFWGFCALRVELACRNVNSARRLMEVRRGRGMRHYLDDLFLARVALLEGSRQTAREHFARLAESVVSYGARGRLNLELRMACELNPADAIDLLWSGLDASSISRPPRPQETAFITVKRHSTGHSIVGISQAMHALRDAVQRLAEADVPVLLTGETGTGKELAARLLHESSPRCEEPFVAVNCGALADSLLESELFGHARGAFTGATAARKGLFEEAGKGSILLDEIGEITPRVQVALLRVLESGEYRPLGSSRPRRIRCRVLAATNANLKELADTGRFRSDLYFRLCRLLIELPPVRERREDIVPLITHCLAEGRRDGAVPQLSPEMQRALEDYDWPGNVREIRSFTERLRLMKSESLHYDVQDLNQAVLGVGPGMTEGPLPPSSGEGASGREPEIHEASRPDEPEKWPNHPRSVARRLDELLKHFHGHGKMSRRDAVRRTGVSPPTAARDLLILAEAGFIEKVMPNRSPRTHYFRLKEGR